MILGPDIQTSYNHLTIMPKLRSTADGGPIYQTPYEGRKAFLRYDSLAKSQDRLSVRILAYDIPKRNLSMSLS